MIAVETVDLSTRGIVLPKERVGMVVAQPYLKLTQTEPYRCVDDAQDNQLAVIRATLEVALIKPHGLEKTHFTIFPEYSVPGEPGIELIQSTLEEERWPTGTVVIAGIHGLTKEEFLHVAGAPLTHTQSNNILHTRVGDQEWVNCSVTWVKGSDNKVERWIQPKFFPAWLEQNTPYQDMFRGDTVFMFRGLFEGETEYRFSSLICFDWIYKQDAQMAWTRALESLRGQVAPGEVSLSWLFVIQCNTQPSFGGFLNEVLAFFDQTVVPNVRRDRTCLVFANTAGKAHPGRSERFGGTSLLFAPQTLYATVNCPATFSNGGQRFRSSTILQGYHDVYFRERGACIHSFVQINPGALQAGAPGRTPPVERAAVFPMPGIADPRAPGAAVPACIKWLLDELDNLESLGVRHSGVPLAEQAETVNTQSKSELKRLTAESVERSVWLASVASSKSTEDRSRWDNKHADEWNSNEVDALEHLVHTLDILSLGFAPPTFRTTPPHATMSINGQSVDIIAVRGRTHEECIKHAERFYKPPNRQRLLVSRDYDNSTWHKRFGQSILEPGNSQIGEDLSFTNPGGTSLHLGYQRLLEIFKTAPTTNAITEGIHAELAA